MSPFRACRQAIVHEYYLTAKIKGRQYPNLPKSTCLLQGHLSNSPYRRKTQQTPQPRGPGKAKRTVLMEKKQSADRTAPQTLLPFARTMG